MKKGTRHGDKLVALRRIEGQVRGIQKMIDDRRYCVDILYAVGAVIGALRNVESRILKDHLQACVKTAFSGTSRAQKNEKIQEIYEDWSPLNQSYQYARQPLNKEHLEILASDSEFCELLERFGYADPFC